MEKMDCYIGFNAPDNASELSDVPPEKMSLYASDYSRRVHGQIRVPRTRWCVLRYPTPGFAQAAGMSTAAFEDFFFDVCTMDYARMDRAMDPLKALMDRTDRVYIAGPGTDLTFSIKGIGSVKCAGENNIPDGEIFTAPVRDSVNGTITYNTPSTQSGFTLKTCGCGLKTAASSRPARTIPRASIMCSTWTRARATSANSRWASIPSSPGR